MILLTWDSAGFKIRESSNGLLAHVAGKDDKNTCASWEMCVFLLLLFLLLWEREKKDKKREWKAVKKRESSKSKQANPIIGNYFNPSCSLFCWVEIANYSFGIASSNARAKLPELSHNFVCNKKKNKKEICNLFLQISTSFCCFSSPIARLKFVGLFWFRSGPKKKKKVFNTKRRTHFSSPKLQ